MCGSESIHTPPMEGHWKEKYEAIKLEFPGGGGVQNEKP